MTGFDDLKIQDQHIQTLFQLVNILVTKYEGKGRRTVVSTHLTLAEVPSYYIIDPAQQFITVFYRMADTVISEIDKTKAHDGISFVTITPSFKHLVALDLIPHPVTAAGHRIGEEVIDDTFLTLEGPDSTDKQIDQQGEEQ